MAAMQAPAGAQLHVLEGGKRKPDRRSADDEAHVEVMAFFAEVEQAAVLIVDAECGLPVVSHRVVNEASKLAHRAAEARREYLSLRGPDIA